jgi:radical SAM protein with 4Fe4S-binding SPASM domain
MKGSQARARNFSPVTTVPPAGDYFEELRKSGKFHPRFCVWELTLACNMRCIHCGSYAGKTRSDELTLEEALRVADDLARLGNQRLTLSGGELLLRDDWHLIADRLIRRGVRVGIITNGFLLERHLDRIRKLRLEVIGISIDGGRQTHDEIRRIPGSFDRVVSAFRDLKRMGFYTAAITSVCKMNLGELDEIHDILAPLGVRAWQIQTIFGGGRMREHRDLLPEPHDLSRIAAFIARKRRASSINVFPADCIGYYTPLEEQIRDQPWSGCYAGCLVVGIESNGNVKGCLSLAPELLENNPFVEGNVRRRSLADIWNDRDAFAYNRKFKTSLLRGFCRRCPHKKKCRGGCTAMAYYVTGSKYDNPYCIHRVEEENPGIMGAPQ